MAKITNLHPLKPVTGTRAAASRADAEFFKATRFEPAAWTVDGGWIDKERVEMTLLFLITCQDEKAELTAYNRRKYHERVSGTTTDNS